MRPDDLSAKVLKYRSTVYFVFTANFGVSAKSLWLAANQHIFADKTDE